MLFGTWAQFSICLTVNVAGLISSGKFTTLYSFAFRSTPPDKVAGRSIMQGQLWLCSIAPLRQHMLTKSPINVAALTLYILTFEVSASWHFTVWRCSFWLAERHNRTDIVTDQERIGPVTDRRPSCRDLLSCIQVFAPSPDTMLL